MAEEYIKVGFRICIIFSKYYSSLMQNKLNNIVNRFSLEHWGKALKIDEYTISRKCRNEKINRIKSYLKILLFSKAVNRINNTQGSGKFLFLKTLERNDYTELFSKIHSVVNEKVIVDVTYKYCCFDIQALLVLYKLLKKRIFLNKRKNKSVLDIIYFYIKAAIYIKTLSILDKYEFEILVVFADMQPVDHLAVEWCKQLNKKTVTLQHGLYIDYAEFNNVNVVNYLNHNSEYFLAWGQETKNLLRKYNNESQIIICGKPIQYPLRTNVSNYFTMVFDQNIFIEQNKKLLEMSYAICEKLNYRVNIKLHPNNSLEWFDIKEEYTLLDKEIKESMFVIGHTTTMIYECMCANIPAFRFKTHIPSNIIQSKLEFSNVDELFMILNDRDLMSANFKEISKQYFMYTGTESLNRYSEVFHRIL